LTIPAHEATPVAPFGVAMRAARWPAKLSAKPPWWASCAGAQLSFT